MKCWYKREFMGESALCAGTPRGLSLLTGPHSQVCGSSSNAVRVIRSRPQPCFVRKPSLVSKSHGVKREALLRPPIHSAPYPKVSHVPLSHPQRGNNLEIKQARGVIHSFSQFSPTPRPGPPCSCPGSCALAVSPVGHLAPHSPVAPFLRSCHCAPEG